MDYLDQRGFQKLYEIFKELFFLVVSSFRYFSDTYDVNISG